MKKTKRIVSLLLIFLLAVGMTFATGCSKKENPAEALAVTVGDNKIYLNEMMYYIYSMETLYTQYYGNSFWDMEYSEDQTMSEYVKQNIMDNAVMYDILYSKAVDADYTLTDEEKTQIESYSDQILSNISDEQLTITGFTKDSLSKVQEKISLAMKYHDELIEGYDIDDQAITDTINPDDYKQYDTEYLFVSTVTYDASYNTVELTEEEKASAKASLTAALDKVKAGEEFSEITEADDTITTNTLNFVYGDTSAAETAYQEAAIKLENDAYTTDIVETDSGYYIIKMVDNTSTESYDAAVEEAISAAEEEAFNADYEVIKEDNPYTINTKVWDPIVIGKTTIVDTDSTTDDAATGSTTDDTTADSTADDATTDSTTDDTTADSTADDTDTGSTADDTDTGSTAGESTADDAATNE